LISFEFDSARQLRERRPAHIDWRHQRPRRVATTGELPTWRRCHPRM